MRSTDRRKDENPSIPRDVPRSRAAGASENPQGTVPTFPPRWTSSIPHHASTPFDNTRTSSSLRRGLLSDSKRPLRAASAPRRLFSSSQRRGRTIAASSTSRFDRLQQIQPVDLIRLRIHPVFIGRLACCWRARGSSPRRAKIQILPKPRIRFLKQ